MTANAHLRVDVFADVVCPWCFIGHARLRTVLAETGNADALVVHHPFLLNASVPEGGHDLREYLKKKYGGDPERMFRAVEEVAHSAGVPLDFARVQKMPSSLQAHVLLRHAELKGTQRELLNAYFTAYFLDSEDIGDDDVLARIATSFGFEEAEARGILTDASDAQQTRAEAYAASTNGITGVPFFVFNESMAFAGVESEAVFREVIAKSVQSLN